MLAEGASVEALKRFLSGGTADASSIRLVEHCGGEGSEHVGACCHQ